MIYNLKIYELMNFFILVAIVAQVAMMLWAFYDWKDKEYDKEEEEVENSRWFTFKDNNKK